jgi:type I restriction enzyme M protein
VLARNGDDLATHYRHVLEELGVIFRKAQNEIQDPAKLRRLIVDLIDRERRTLLDADVSGRTTACGRTRGAGSTWC